MTQIYPSLICADLLNLEKEISRLDPFVAGYHLDVMDFHFVPNLTWGPDFITAIAKATDKPLMVHLMVEYPEKYFDRLALRKKDYLSVHPESRSDIDFSMLLAMIKKQGWIPSIALNPETPISYLKSLDEQPPHVLLMSVNPGFSGQEFMPIVYDKLDEFYNIRTKENCIVAVDGGITIHNTQKLLSKGAHQLVVGSALFSASDPIKVLKEISRSPF